MLIDVARFGDFSYSKTRKAARIGWTLEEFAKRGMPQSIPYDEACSQMYQSQVFQLLDICDNIDRYEPDWNTADKKFDTTEEMIKSKKIKIEEHADLDLTIVNIPESIEYSIPALYQTIKGKNSTISIHHHLGFRVLFMQGNQYKFTYRYESWVEYQSKPAPLPRIDLDKLAEQLSALETNKAVWKFEGVKEIIPSLSSSKPSTIPPEQFIQLLSKSLTQ